MIYLIVGIISFAFGISSVLFFQSLEVNKLKKGVVDMFSKILKDKGKLKFIKRINKHVYFKYKNWDVIYVIDNSDINIFEKEECIATSTQILNNSVILELQSFIKKRWSKHYNNTVTVDNNIFSMNFIEEQRRKYESQWSDPLLSQLEKDEDENIGIDDLLDKINKIGFNNLTEKEIELLKKISND